jgi:hypothetical protein
VSEDGANDDGREATDGGEAAGGEGATDHWPAPLRGVTESVVATLGPNDLWNLAALGLHAPSEAGDRHHRDGGGDRDDGGDADSADATATDVPPGAVTATTWGNTRTRRNFGRQGGGVVQFVTDPRDFVDAALTIREEPTPVLDSADAWVEVRATAVASGESGGTDWQRWRLDPVASEVRRTGVRTINRGFAAVVDATVAASRLDVPAYDTDVLLDRLRYFADTVERCGGPVEREAFARIDAETDWRSRLDAE